MVLIYGEIMVLEKEILFSGDEYLILGLMEILRKNKLIGKFNEFGGTDEILFHSGGPINDKSRKSIIIGPPNLRFRTKQPSKKSLAPNSRKVNPIEGEISLGPKPPKLIWDIEKWKNNKWEIIDKVDGESLSKSLKNLEIFLPNQISSPGTSCGVFAYDLCQWTQPWQLIHPPKEDSLIGIIFSIDRWLVHDRLKKIIKIGSINDEEWVNRVFDITKSVEEINHKYPKWPQNNPRFRNISYSNISDKKHIEKIKKVKSAIQSGELYQLNYGRKWKGELTEEPWKLQLRLAKDNPAPWSFFIH
jgi:anthranilate/para-aminobenzoate synthase component I